MTSFGTYSVNSGSCYGDGYSGTTSGVSQGVYSSSSYKRTPTSTNLRNISRDLQSAVGSDAFYEIDDYLDRGNIDSAFNAFDEILDQAKEKCSYYGYEMSDAEIKSALLQAYENEMGVNLRDKVSDSTSGSVGTGFAQGLFVLPFISDAFVNGTSRAEALAILDDKKVDDREENLENVGKLAGNIVTGLGIGAAVHFGAFPAIAGAAVALYSAAPAIAIGLAIGAGIGLVRFGGKILGNLFSKN